MSQEYNELLNKCEELIYENETLKEKIKALEIRHTADQVQLDVYKTVLFNYPQEKGELL